MLLIMLNEGGNDTCRAYKLVGGILPAIHFLQAYVEAKKSVC